MAHLYFAQWQWVTTVNEDGDTLSHWTAPQAAFCVGRIDMRPDPAQATPVIVDGFAVFSYSQPVTIPGAKYYGEDPYRIATQAEKDAWKAKLGITEALEGDRLVDIMWNTLGIHADPTGQNRPRPIMPTSFGMLELHLGGFSLIKQKQFAVGMPEWANIRAVLQNEYRRVRQESRGRGDQTHYKKVLGAWEKKYRVDYRQFIPADLPDEGRVPPQTTLSDNFNRANENPIAGWGEEGTADFEIVGNQGEKNTTGATTNGSISINGNLSTDDHYAKAKIVSFPAAGGTRSFGPMTRKHGTLATRTAYVFAGNGTSASPYRTLDKYVAGTATNLANDTTAPVANDTWECEANGSTIRGLINSVQVFSQTDTGITANTKVGLAHWETGRGTDAFDDFEGADLAAASHEFNPGRRIGVTIGAP